MSFQYPTFIRDQIDQVASRYIQRFNKFIADGFVDDAKELNEYLTHKYSVDDRKTLEPFELLGKLDYKNKQIMIGGKKEIDYVFKDDKFISLYASDSEYFYLFLTTLYSYLAECDLGLMNLPKRNSKDLILYYQILTPDQRSKLIEWANNTSI